MNYQKSGRIRVLSILILYNFKTYCIFIFLIGVCIFLNFKKMRKNIFILTLVVVALVSSCSDKEDVEYYNLATPVLLSLDEVRKSVEVLPPKEIHESGKIYSYEDYVFINDKNKGVHIVNNKNPKNPIKVAYIKIPGNVDISVKNDILYANSFVDLLVFDFSNIANIKKVNIVKDIFPYYFQIPEGADVVNWERVNYGGSFPVDWEITREKRQVNEYTGGVFFNEIASVDTKGGVGVGGSLARFKIVGSHLYVVDSHDINVFNIENLAVPVKLQSVRAGFDIETIFNRGDHLFLGSMSGMYIYDISNPGLPTFISEFQHGTACDPVVVDDNYAYITLRAGNSCGAFDSSLQIVDISNISVPILKESYDMDEPYGLGIQDEKLFICDGTSGLKVYDKTNVGNLRMLNHFKDIQTFDVIPLKNHLLMIGDEVLHQYTYHDNSIKLLSSFNLR